MFKVEQLTDPSPALSSLEATGAQMPPRASGVMALRNEIIPAGSRREQLARQRQKLEECLDVLERVTRERNQLWKDLCRTGDLTDNALAEGERAQQRVMELQAELSQKDARIRELTEENAALLEQGFTLAERLDLAEARWRVLAHD